MSNRDLTLSDANGGCACCAPASPAKSEAPTVADAVSENFLVAGMTCSHCVSSVTEELGALDGVQGVDVQLNAGGTSKVTVASSVPLDVQKVRDAVSEAGYDLVDSAP